MGLMGYRNLRDMFDGGGAGRAGQKFEGGLFSGLLNSLGVDPLGANARMAEARPVARPARPYGGPATQSKPVAQKQPQPTQPLTIGGMSEGDISAAISRGAPAFPDLVKLWESEEARLNAQRASVPFPFSYPPVNEITEMDAERRAVGYNVPAFAPSAPTVSPQVQATRETDEDRIRRQLEENGLVLPEGVMGALLPSLLKTPRISQRVALVQQYLARNNMAPQSTQPSAMPWKY